MKKRAALMDIIKYSFGGIGSNMAFILIMSYITFFYTDVLGISAMTAAALMLVARIIDVLTDPLMGIIADNTRCRWGRFRPYIMFGAPLLGINIFLLFTAPDLAPGAKVVYAYVVYIAYSLISTVVNIPYHSLPAVMTEDTSQRTVIVSWKQGMMVVPQLLISLSLPIVSFFGGSTTSAYGWSVYGAIAGIITTVSFLICAWGGKPYDTMEKIEKTMGEKREKNILKDLLLVFKNKPLLMLFIAFGTDLFAMSATNAVNAYYFKYVLHQESWIASTGFISMLVSVFAVFTVVPLAKWLGKKRLTWWFSVLCIIPNVIMLFIPSPSLAILTTMLTTYNFMGRITGTMAWTMLPDCVDWGELKYGKRIDGLSASSMTFMNKFANAVAGSAVLAVLGMMGFVANQEQSAAVCGAIVAMRFAIPIAGHVATLISLAFYELTESKMKEIADQLDKRHAQTTM